MDVSSIIAVMTKSVFRHCQMSPEGQNCPSVKKHYCKQISNSVVVSISNRKWREICMSILPSQAMVYAEVVVRVAIESGNCVYILLGFRTHSPKT